MTRNFQSSHAEILLGKEKLVGLKKEGGMIKLQFVVQTSQCLRNWDSQYWVDYHEIVCCQMLGQYIKQGVRFIWLPTHVGENEK